MTVDKGVELTLVVPDAPPAGSSATSGGSGGSKTLKDWGKLWLSEQRVVFVADSAAAGSNAPLQSLSVPLLHVLATSFQQPVFGANYFAFDVRPVPNGGLTSGTKVEVRFKDRGLQEFIGTLEKVRERAMYMKREEDDLEDSLPVYSGAPSTSHTPVPPPPGPDELPPGYDA
ncbi:hypothetical protein EXIGLDRAFT_724847 [Exidia glandulosa HHB12029]|nr:hypothetical protein EXIGLDRAFT_724847 [Exidia glandulosa HHB12029]